MPLLQFGPWQPDTTDYEATTVNDIQNVLPRGDGYGPFPSFAAATQALFAPCRGAFYALKSDGSVQVFAGTSNALYLLNSTNLSWTPCSRPSNCTITNASPGVVSLTNTFTANEPVVFQAGGGTLPSQIVAGTVYYVSATGLTGSTFSVSTTAGGSRINTSGGSGTVNVTAHYSAVSSNAQWQWAQFGNLVFATQANDVLQVLDLSSGAITFSNCAGSPPQAAYISVVGRFLVLSGLLSNPYRIQWSGLNATTTWTSGVNSSDFQDFPDGGVVRGVAGGEFGTVFQDQAMRRMDYIPGSALIFQIERITQDQGLYAPYSIIRAGSDIYFYSGKGFYKISPGALPVQIGRERVDRTFFMDLDPTQLQLFMGAADPRGTRVYWAYKSGAGSAGFYDKIIGYDSALDRFFKVDMSGEFLLGVSQSGLSLENLDTISSSIDALTLSLDTYGNAVQPEIAQFDVNNMQGFFRGANLEATIETAEQGTDGARILINGFRLITDATQIFGSCSFRELRNIPAISTTEIAMNTRTGMCDIHQSTRYSRLKIRIAAGDTWTYAAGIEPVISREGAV